MPPQVTKMFSVREVPWHGMGEILEDYPGREEAMRKAGHTWKIVERPVFVGIPSQSIDDSGYGISGAPGTPFENQIFSPGDINGWKALVRDDTGKVLGVMRETYSPIQWSTMWDVVDAIVDQPNVHYETGGLLKGGALGWVLAWLDEPSQIPGDESPIYPWLCGSTTHDGSGALTAMAFDIRVVCANTFSAFKRGAESAGTSYTFRHRGDPLQRVEEARDVVKGVRQSHLDFVELATELSKLEVTDAGVEMFVTRFLPEPVQLTDRVVRNLEKRREAVRDVLDSKTCAGIRNTAYGLSQAAGEFLDHLRPYRSGETYFARTVLKHEPLKASAVGLAREIASEFAPVG